MANEGEKRFTSDTKEGMVKKLVMQCCDVSQELLSVSKATASGNRVVFDDDGSCIGNKVSGEQTCLKQQNVTYTLRLWVKRPL